MSCFLPVYELNSIIYKTTLNTSCKQCKVKFSQQKKPKIALKNPETGIHQQTVEPPLQRNETSGISPTKMSRNLSLI